MIQSLLTVTLQGPTTRALVRLTLNTLLLIHYIGCNGKKILLFSLLTATSFGTCFCMTCIIELHPGPFTGFSHLKTMPTGRQFHCIVGYLQELS